MKDRDKKIIQRYINGEKKLSSKLREIYDRHDNEPNDIYVDYINGFFEDDIPKMFAAKVAIRKEAPLKMMKPSFEKRNK